jgi:hypothetical protein
VIRVIDSYCYVIQKSQRSKSITVHRDKLKVCCSSTPTSWLSPVGISQPETSKQSNDLEEGREVRRLPPRRRSSTEQNSYDIGPPDTVCRQKRNFRRPNKYDDYVCRRMETTVIADHYCRPCNRRFRSVEAVRQHLRCGHLLVAHTDHYEEVENEHRLHHETGLQWNDVCRLRLLEQQPPIKKPRTMPKVTAIATCTETQSGEPPMETEPPSAWTMATAMVSPSAIESRQLLRQSHVEDVIKTAMTDSSGINDLAVRIEAQVPGLNMTQAELLAAAAHAGARMVAEQVLQLGGDVDKERLVAVCGRWSEPPVDLTIVPSSPTVAVTIDIADNTRRPDLPVPMKEPDAGCARVRGVSILSTVEDNRFLAKVAEVLGYSQHLLASLHLRRRQASPSDTVLQSS